MPALISVPVLPNGFAWFSEAEGTHMAAIDRATYTSLARKVRQTYTSRGWFGNAEIVDILPVVIEYVILPETNNYGHDVLATVQYSRSGACSSMGGRLGADGRIVWSCYAD